MNAFQGNISVKTKFLTRKFDIFKFLHKIPCRKLSIIAVIKIKIFICI